MYVNGKSPNQCSSTELIMVRIWCWWSFVLVVQVGVVKTVGGGGPPAPGGGGCKDDDGDDVVIVVVVCVCDDVVVM